MAYQTIFKRVELKYMITEAQKALLLREMAPYMSEDTYGRTEIRNLYLDTPDYRLIRRSIEKPVYKEKMRLRSYGRAHGEDTVFVELKKKYKSVVYKRRLSMTEAEALAWMKNETCTFPQTQIAKEITYFIDFYKTLRPMAFISYEREAYFSKESSGFRVTFDRNILYRGDTLTLDSDTYGVSLLKEGCCLMEIKCAGAIPLWLVRVLSREEIYKTSFSKYGTAYQKIILPKLKERKNYA